MGTSLQGEDESRTSSPPYEAMDKSLKVEGDEWRENVNHEDFDDVKKIKPWIMSVIIKKRENMDHALF